MSWAYHHRGDTIGSPERWTMGRLAAIAETVKIGWIFRHRAKFVGTRIAAGRRAIAITCSLRKDGGADRRGLARFCIASGVGTRIGWSTLAFGSYWGRRPASDVAAGTFRRVT
jgi:hypothetical protein